MKGIDVGILLLLIWISRNDWKHRKIPNRGIVLLFLLGIWYVWKTGFFWEGIVGGCIGFGGLFFGLYCLTGGRILGAGDIKLLAVCGLRLGFDGIAMAFLLGAGLGIVVQGIRQRAFLGREAFPMAPYLCFGIIWMLFQ